MLSGRSGIVGSGVTLVLLFPVGQIPEGNSGRLLFVLLIPEIWGATVVNTLLEAALCNSMETSVSTECSITYAGGSHRFKDINPMLSSYAGFIAFCAHFKVLIRTYKALYGFGPGYLKDHVFQCNLVCVLHSSKEGVLSVPLAGGNKEEEPSWWWSFSFKIASPEIPALLLF